MKTARSLPSLANSLLSKGRLVSLNNASMTRIISAVPEESAAAIKLGGSKDDWNSSLGTKPKIAPVPL
jgi:hypothetical protein